MTEKKNWYDKSYRWIMIIPAVMLIFSLVYLTNFNARHGDVILKDVTITGGTSVTVFDKSVDLNELESFMGERFPDVDIRGLSEFRTGEQRGFILETKKDVEEVVPVVEEFLGYELNQENSSIEFSGSSLSEGFYNQLRFAILLAFIFMAIVVFIIFKTSIPSIAVILSAFADIVMTLAFVNLAGMTLSIAGVIAFLMLIGYSVDTDILLTSRVLKRREGSVNERLYGSLKTGIMMTLTSMVAIGVSLLIISGISEVLKQIFTILLIGLGFDILNTWLANASILKWYVEHKEKK